MKKYRVWIPLYTFYNCRGGSEKQAEKLSLKLVEKGSSINIITADFLNKNRPIPETEGFRCTLLPSVYKGNSSLLRKINAFSFMIQLFFYLIMNSQKYDVLKTFFVDKMTAVAILSGLITRKPVIILEANIRKMENSNAGFIDKTIEKFLFMIYKKASVIVAISDEIRDEYVNDFNVPPEKIQYIQNGVEIFEKRDKFALRKKLGLSEDKIYAVIAARFSFAKNHERLLQTWKILVDKNPNVVLVCLGMGEFMQKCQNYINENNLQNNILLKGAVDNVFDYLQAADLFVFPSKYEGMPNALAEAMSAGLPCIVSKIRAHEALIEHNKSGLLFDLAQDNEKFVEMILDLLESKNKQIELSKNASQAAKSFSLDAIADKYYRLYETLIYKDMTKNPTAFLPLEEGSDKNK